MPPSCPLSLPTQKKQAVANAISVFVLRMQKVKPKERRLQGAAKGTKRGKRKKIGEKSLLFKLSVDLPIEAGEREREREREGGCRVE